MKKVKTLLRVSKPYSDESFASWILRLSEKNHYASPQWILELAGLERKISQINTLSSKQHSLSLLSQITLTQENTLWSLVFQEIHQNSNNEACVRFFGNHIPAYFIHTKTSRICILCLAETAYCKGIWELALVTACPIHKCFLLDKCPKCGRDITWLRMSLTCCNFCKYDWRKAQPIFLTEDEIALSYWVYQLCNIPVVEKPVTELLSSKNPASSLELEELANLICFLAKSFIRSLGIDDTTFRSILKSQGLFHCLATRSLLLLKSWPLSFYEFIYWLKTHPLQYQFPDLRVVSNPDVHFQKFQNKIYERFSDKNFYFLVEAFEKTIANTRENDVGNSLSWQGRSDQIYMKFIPLFEVTHNLKILEGDAIKLISNGYLEVESPNKLIALASMIKLDSLEIYKRASKITNLLKSTESIELKEVRCLILLELAEILWIRQIQAKHSVTCFRIWYAAILVHAS